MESLDDNVTADLKFSIVPEWLIDSGCSDKAVRLYVVLARYADNENLTAYPGRGTLAKRMGCHRASVDRAVEELVALGAISKQVRFKDGKYQSSLYTVRRIAPSRTHATTPVAPMQRPSSHPCDIELEPMNVEPKNSLAAAPQEKSAKKDDLFESVAEACNIDWKNLTASGRGQLNKSVKELRDIGVTADQVGGRAAAYKKTYPDAPLTPSALAKHWAALTPVGTVRKSQRPTCPDCHQHLDDHDQGVHEAFAGRV
jgi:biotin operon repressor